MKKIILTLLTILLFFSLSADGEKFDKINFGLGFGLGVRFPVETFDNDNQLFIIAARVLMPIQIHRHFRVEPLFALNKMLTWDGDNDGGYRDNLALNTGFGLFFTYPIHSTMIVTGIRSYISFYRHGYEEPREYSGVYIEPVISGEYFFRHISIAAEIAGSFYIPNKKTFHLNLVTNFYFRWYFL